MLERIDHVGIVVADLERGLEGFTSALGMTLSVEAQVPSRGVRVARLAVGEAAIELIQPVRVEGRAAAFLRERGQGLHHVAFRVRDLAEVAPRLSNSGFQQASLEPREGAFGRRVVELPPEAFAGVVVQLVL